MLRASSLHRFPFVFPSPSPISALLPAHAVHGGFPCPLLRESRPPLHLRASHSLPIYRPSYHFFSSKSNRLPSMAGQPFIAKATGLSMPLYRVLCCPLRRFLCWLINRVHSCENLQFLGRCLLGGNWILDFNSGLWPFYSYRVLISRVYILGRGLWRTTY